MAKEKKFYLTKEGFLRLKREFEELKKLKKLRSTQETPILLQSEELNPEYLAFKEDMFFIEARLAELERVLKNAQILKKPPKNQRNIVQIGAKVTLQDSEGKINEFILTESIEANPNEGKISINSPVGRALFGKKIGDEVIITSPIKVVYKIKKITYLS